MRKAPIAAVVLCLAACDPQGGADAGPDPLRPTADSAPARPTSASPTPAADSSPAPAPAQDTSEPVAEADTAEVPEAPAEPEVPRPPSDYGQIKPSHDPPKPSELTVHALAGYEVVPVYDEPNIESKKLGYLRIGQRLMVTPKVEGEGCPGGWYQTPEGTYACSGKRGGLQVDAKKPPYLYKSPPPPRTDEAFPYDYAYVRKWNTPMWWRVPNKEERAEANKQRAVLEAKREGKPLPGETPPATTSPATPGAPAKAPEQPVNGVAPAKGSAADKKLQASKSLPSVTDDVTPAAVAKPPKAEEPLPPIEPVAAEPEPEPEPIKLPLSPAKPWLEKGFFIALAEKVTEDGMSFWRTARGAYVPSGSTGGKYNVKNFEGQALSEEQDFPFGFAMLKKKPTKVYELQEDGKLKVTGKLGYRTFVDLAEETEINGKAYMLTEDGQLILKYDLRLPEPQPVPEGLEPWERWIDVDLTKQMLVAYEGDRPVYVTLVSTGKKGTKEEPFDTPTGRWRIYSKHTTTTMDGSAGEGNYSIQDVPWAQYFNNNIALHAAFWHEGFGRVRSHGCVNLGATDARWLFHWTTPYLPRGWHGVHAHEGSPGTTVVVHK